MEKTESVIQKLVNECRELRERINKLEEEGAFFSKTILNLDDVAKLTGMKKSYIYKLTHECRIPYYKSEGKILYFKRDEIEGWLLRRRQDTKEESHQKALRYIVGREKGNII